MKLRKYYHKFSYSLASSLSSIRLKIKFLQFNLRVARLLGHPVFELMIWILKINSSSFFIRKSN